MKIKLIWFCIVIMILTGCNRTNEIGEPDCVHTSSFNDELYLTIVANRNEIEDPEAFAKEILEMYKNNSFKSIKLSIDIQGFSEQITAKVYLYEKDIYKEEPMFVIEYVFLKNSIVDITIF